MRRHPESSTCCFLLVELYGELDPNSVCTVQICRGKQAAQERRKVEDEEAELRETQRLLDVDRRAAEAAKQAVAQEHERVQAENAARIAAKHAAAAREKAEDKALMEETIRTLEKQAANRAQATKDFHVRFCTCVCLAAGPWLHWRRRCSIGSAVACQRGAVAGAGRNRAAGQSGWRASGQRGGTAGRARGTCRACR